MATELKFYCDLLSQPCRAVYMFLRLNNIPFEHIHIAIRKGDTQSSEYAEEVSALRTVPAIDDNGFKLAESVAILKYLSDKYHVADHWYPKDLQSRALVDSFMAWQHLNTRLAGGTYFLTKIALPQINRKPVNKTQLKQFEQDLEIALDNLEQIYLKSGAGFRCGSEITLADLLAICEIMQPLACGHDVFRNRRRLEAWSLRVKKRIGAKLFNDAHRVIFMVRDRYATSNPSAARL